MSNLSGTLWITFNGEIYNFLELRAELERDGVTFHSKTDTEVILALYERHGTDHHEFVVKPEAVEVLPELVWHYNEPYADSSAIPTYYLSKMTRQHVTVALNGDAGDENFAGYERYLAK